MAEGARTRGRRSDARRNVERLLAAADTAFGRDGTDASLERIARDAGVAVGTLYSHFPGRRALIAALLRERHDALLTLGEQLLTDPDLGGALLSWVRAVARHAATYRGLATVLAGSLSDQKSELHSDCARLGELTDRFATAAREAGLLRPGVSGPDLTALMSAAAWVQEHLSTEHAERLISLALTGFCP